MGKGAGTLEALDGVLSVTLSTKNGSKICNSNVAFLSHFIALFPLALWGQRQDL